MARLVFIDSVPSLIASSRCRLILLVRNVVPPSHHSCLFEVVENCHLFSAVVNVSLMCAAFNAFVSLRIGTTIIHAFLS